MKLEQLLEAAAENMAADLRRRLISHPGELGTAREQIVRDFLASHLPKRFEVSTGFAFDSTGRMSGQLDIVIFDADVCPRFEVPGGKFLFPCEAVVAVGQVKSSMCSYRELCSALENLESAKSLDRTARGSARDYRFNEKLHPDENHLHQIFTFVFVTGEALEAHSVAEMLFDQAYERSANYLPNVILAMDRYLITYCCNDGVCPNPMEARGVAIQSAGNPADVIMRFYLLLGQALDATRTASLPYGEYLSKYDHLPAMVVHSSVESPPPRLGRWTEGK